MKKTFIATLLFVLLLAPASSISAETRDRETLIDQLQMLLGQLIAIQIELQKTAEPRVAGIHTSRLQPSTYYQGPYEAIYTIDGTDLSPYKDTIFAQSDIELWNILKDVMGKRAIRDYITEFRVYNDTDAKFDAFVEQIAGTDDWIFGVNLASDGFNSNFREEIATELFIHEYAHILYHYHHFTADTFEEEFWVNRSHKKSDFVSDYAMQSSEEDFAESFMYFVLEQRPHGSTRADRKVRFFYDYDLFRDIREDIRDRLFD